MPGRVAGLSRAMRCAIMLRDTRPSEIRRGQVRRLGRSVPRCVYCDRGVIPRAQVGESRYGAAAATMDHVVAGGPTTPANLVTCCWACNCRWKDNPKPPHLMARARAATRLPLDLASGRLWARELYPRPSYSGGPSDDSQRERVYAGCPCGERCAPRRKVCQLCADAGAALRRGPGRRHGGAEPLECAPA